jgi:hypothetical protein
VAVEIIKDKAMQIAELVVKYVWPLILGWNIFLFDGVRSQQLEHLQYRLFVSEHYTSKADLKNMFDGFEKRFDEKFSMVVTLVDNKKQ